MNSKIENTIKTYNHTAESYAENTEGLLQRDDLGQFLAYLPKTSSKILDLGCGPGRDTYYFNQQGYSVVGVDLSERLLDIARKKTEGGIFVLGDMTEDLGWKNEFDGVWSCAAYVHVPRTDAINSLKNVHNYLKPEGILSMSFMGGTGEEVRVSKRYGDAPGKGEKFWNYYGEKEMIGYLEKIGFEILDVKETPNKFSEEHPWFNVFAKK